MTGTLSMALRVTCLSFITSGLLEGKKRKRKKKKSCVVLCCGLPLLCDRKMLCFDH